MQAIILKKIPIREYDELVVCYTQDAGKQVYQAKSILRPESKQVGHLDVLNLVDFSLVRKNSHPIITSAYCLKAFPQLKASLSAMAAAYFLLECFDKLIFENESDPTLWNFLLTQLHYYNTLSTTTMTVFAKQRRSLQGWPEVIAFARQELLGILGYDHSMPIEHLANARFKSLQFAREVLN